MFFAPSYRFRSPVHGEFTGKIRDLLIKFLAADLNSAVTAIGPGNPADRNVTPAIAGDFFPVRILTSAGQGMPFDHVCITLHNICVPLHAFCKHNIIHCQQSAVNHST